MCVAHVWAIRTSWKNIFVSYAEGKELLCVSSEYMIIE